MKVVTCFALTLLLCCSVALANQTSNRGDLQSDMETLKANNVTYGDPSDPLQGGEDIGSAAPIPALPYSDSGSTAGALNDYDEACPFTGSTSPDVVYSYAPGSDGAIDIDLCNSGFDTKVYVYENAAGNLVACNDDACGTDGFRSELLCVPVTAGNTYYIVVDGFGGASGSYDLNVDECQPCVVDCPPGSVLEGEPDCFDGYKDSFNSGCNNAGGPVFSSVPCAESVTVCGRYGGYFHTPSGFNYRDTDWYELPADGLGNPLTFCVTGELETLAGYINGGLGCGAPVFEDFAVVGACDTACFSIPAGMNAWLFVATANFGAEAGPCGSDYTMTVDGLKCVPVSVEAKTWTEIKESYRE